MRASASAGPTPAVSSLSSPSARSPLLVPSPASAGTPPVTAAPTSTEPRITLEAQDPFTPVGGVVTFRADIANAPPGATVNLNAYQPLTTAVTSTPSRRAVRRGCAHRRAQRAGRRPRGGPRHRLACRHDRAAIAEPPAGSHPSQRARPACIPSRSTSATTPGRTIAVVRDHARGRAADDRPSITEPLNVVWVWPLVAAPSYLPRGSPDREVTAQFLPEGRLGRQAVARAAPDVPVTLSLGPETLEAWSEDPIAQGGAETIVAPRRTRPSAPLRPHRPPLAARPRARRRGRRGLARGADVLRSTIGSTPDAHLAARPVSAPSLARLEAAASIAPSSTAPRSPRRPPPPPRPASWS